MITMVIKRLLELDIDPQHRWKLEVLELPGNVLGFILYGPRGKKYYLPPILENNERLPLPKYVREKLRKLIYL